MKENSFASTGSSSEQYDSNSQEELLRQIQLNLRISTTKAQDSSAISQVLI